MNPVEHPGTRNRIFPELLTHPWLAWLAQVCNVTLGSGPPKGCCGVVGRCGALGMPRLAGCLAPVPWGKLSSPGSPLPHQQ